MRYFLLLVLLFAASFVLAAQQPGLEPSAPGQKPAPTVTFDLVFPGSVPAHYSVAVESTGRAAYRSDDLAPTGSTDRSDGLVKFTVSEATRARIFKLAADAHYFDGNFDYMKGRVANTGAKTLIYSEGPAESFGQPANAARHSTTYNFSVNPAIQQLTTIFQNIGNSLELGQRLAHLRRFDRLGLDTELKRAEEMAGDGRLLELQSIAPVLQDIVNDSSAMHIARQRAQHLLKLAQAASAGK